MIKINIPEGKKVYFASDFHFGAPNEEQSKAREKRVVKWLDEIQHDAHAVFLVGDLYDFWFEYKHVVPKGYVRFLGKIAELVDKGIEVNFYIGNHDLWMFGYFEKELGVRLFKKPEQFLMNGTKFYVGHGDGLGPGDYGFKLLKKYIFMNKAFQWCFARLHPNFALGFANFCSKLSRDKSQQKDLKFLGKDNEWLYQYACEIEANEHHDFYLFGHRHLPMDLEVGDNARYINLGEWINFNTYVTFDGSTVDRCTFES